MSLLQDVSSLQDRQLGVLESGGLGMEHEELPDSEEDEEEGPPGGTGTSAASLLGAAARGSAAPGREQPPAVVFECEELGDSDSEGVEVGGGGDGQGRQEVADIEFEEEEISSDDDTDEAGGMQPPETLEVLSGARELGARHCGSAPLVGFLGHKGSLYGAASGPDGMDLEAARVLSFIQRQS